MESRAHYAMEPTWGYSLQGMAMLRHEEEIACSVILHVTRPHKRTKDVVTGRVFESSKCDKCVWRPDPLRKLERSPDPIATIGRGVLLTK